MRMSPLKTAFIIGVATSLVRLLINLVVAALAFRWPETPGILLLDLPTMAAYGVAESLGSSWPIPSPSDLRFLAISSTVWFTLAFLLASAIAFSVPRIMKIRG